MLLSACGAAPPPSGPEPADLSLQTRALSSQTLFGAPRPYAPERSNAQIAKDILELGFRLESGREIPHFSRFEGTVTLSLQGQIPPLAVIETDRLLTRMRTEAGLDIRRVDSNGRVIVEFVPRAQMRRVVRDAACFVLPNIADWASFRANPRAEALDWTQVTERRRALVIAPADSTVQEMRDCLHEEIAQAVGPLNDLFRIGESVMNDDNFQTTLTGFDMLVLRVWNDPALRPGMTRAEVAERLPALLARLNPRGERAAARALPLDPVPTPRDWTDAVEDALRSTSNRTGFRHARRALAIALEQGWQDERLAFSLFLAARFAPPGEGQQALDALALAHRIYQIRPGTQAHGAHVSLHLAAQSLATDQHDLVLRLTERAMVAAQRTENGALLSSLMLLRAQALEATGNRAEAEKLRRDAVPFALFGFGSEHAAKRRAQEVAALGQRE
ncbi:MAG: DUF2927 domain-containing protein [Rhodobacteraceae bacterium]|nr:DUF2927 domain-containing protein [Paracoccaceae bacterium]